MRTNADFISSIGKSEQAPRVIKEEVVGDFDGLEDLCYRQMTVAAEMELVMGTIEDPQGLAVMSAILAALHDQIQNLKDKISTVLSKYGSSGTDIQLYLSDLNEEAIAEATENFNNNKDT